MSVTRTLRDTVAVARDRNLTFLAAGVVYYAFTSIPPLVLLALVVGTALVGPSFATALVELVSSQLSSSGERLVEEMLRSEDGRVGAGIAGFVVLAWSALKLFLGLEIAFEELYGVEGDGSLGERVRNAVVVAVATAIVVGVLAASSAVFQAPSVVAVPYPGAVGAVVLFVGLVAAFLPVYYVFPPVETSLRGVLPGVVVAAVGWSVLQVLFQLYAANASRYAAYGIIGAVLLFVTWLYFAGIVVLLGATVNAVVGGDAAPDGTSDTPAARRSAATGNAPRR